MTDNALLHTRPSADFLAGGGELGARMRAMDWSQTSLGPPETWPQSLRTCVRIILTSRQPMFVWWGEELINLYNDAYKQIVGGKHPWALGSPASRVWSEIWSEVGPRAESAMLSNEGTYDEALLLIMERNGYAEETYYTFSYSPVPNDQGGTGGILCANTDDTQRIIGERQIALLRELASRTGDARTFREAATRAAESLALDPRDLPFALLYLLDAPTSQLELASSAGVAAGHAAAPPSVALDDDSVWPFAAALRADTPVVVPDLANLQGLPTGGWDRAPRQAVVIPIGAVADGGKAAVLIVGLNPFRLYDDAYRRFLELVSAQIAASIANAQAYEDARERADALAELDRAKTTFFSNVSHEFRTPLTLMLGPLEDILGKPEGELLPENRELLSVMHRNGQRLMKLVNTLLDFSRIEAGRVQASFTPTDIAAFTAELASVFRAAIEKAGMTLTIDAPPLSQPVYVDHDMWEKIVLNLVSNAFKYTLEGGIEVSVREHQGAAVLTVRDTGIGVPPSEMPKLFNRFHRVEGARGRTHEGTGIGLALVQELVKQHGGTVAVESEEGKGTAFSVSIPFGTQHLPSEKLGTRAAVAPTTVGAQPFVDEALRWLPAAEGHAPMAGIGGDVPARSAATGPRPKIVLADDNADMREYVQRLLLADYEVIAVADGVEALHAAVTNQPALVLTDVMMPNLDGFGLLQALRADPVTAAIPVIMLSARAGEESRVEGLQAGADDYVVKPFSARELLARVGGILELTRVRREAGEALRRSEQRYRSLIEATAAIVWTAGTAGTFQEPQPRWSAFTGQTFEELQGRGWLDAVHPEDQIPSLAAFADAQLRGGVCRLEHRLRRYDGEYRLMSVRAVPLRGSDGAIREWIGVHTDITTERVLQQKLDEERLRLYDVFMRAPAFIATIRGPEHIFEIANPLYMQLVGDQRSIIGKPVREALPEVEGQGFFELLDNVYRTGEPFIGSELPVRLSRAEGGEERYVDFVYQPMRDAAGKISGIFVHGNDVTEQVRARQIVERQATELERANLALRDQMLLNRTMTDNAAAGLFMMDAEGHPTFMNPAAEEITGYTLEETRGRRLHEILHSRHPDGSVYGADTCPISSALRDSLPLKDHRDVFVRKDGTFFPVACFLAPLAGSAGGAVLEFRDITEDERAQEALRAADRRKNEFIATLSHELRTPLTAILGWARMLKLGLTDEETTKVAIDTIDQSARVQAQLIDDVLDISRITSGKVRIEPETVRITDVTSAATDTVRLAAEARDVRLVVDRGQADEAMVLGDPNRLQQIVWNLLSNAIKFTPSGGEVRLNVSATEGMITIQVRDSGIGIRPDFLPYVFEPFRQAESTSTRVHGGLGLGLSIVRYLVELHGGRISAESEGEGRGSTFTIELPRLREKPRALAAAPVATPLPEEPSHEMANLQGLTVLVIDDQAAVREYLAAVLARGGATVLAAESVQDGIREVQRRVPDVVLCDIAMPGEDGYAFVRWIRSIDWPRYVPVLAITAFGGSDDEQRAARGGFDGYVRKPIDPERLTKAVAGVVGKG
jgi:PAS domain S-box-containing protein